MKGDKIDPILIDGAHYVQYRELRRVHGADGVAIWARAVAVGARVNMTITAFGERIKLDLIRWDFYSRCYDAAKPPTTTDKGQHGKQQSSAV